MEPIDLRLASVREARSAERRFCFEVITPAYKRVYQATSEEDMNNWINAINNALQSAFEGRNNQPQFSPTDPTHPPSLRRDIGSILTGKSSSNHTQLHHSQSQSTSSSKNSDTNVGRRTTVGARPSYIRTDSGSYNENPTKLLQEIRERDQGNSYCADCNSNIKTEWCSINLGIILCIECSGIHRSLGTHISKIRSLTLDTVSFTADIVEVIMQIGNRLSNAVWEARLDSRLNLKPPPNATRDQRLRFITDKYVRRLYVNPISPTLSAFSTADEILLASVKKNDIAQVLYALALRASPNAVDRSRNTHVIFLALAAADPATPGTPGTPPTTSYSSKSTPTQSSITPKRLPVFPIAEFLLQNGGEIPSALPAFPLSVAAKEFVEQRSAKDQLSALPTIRSPAGGGSGGGGGGGGTSTAEKAAKRSSGGNRFGGRNLANLAGLGSGS
jgi:Arf-GAP/SH3 domain/ANK repeat/PH domain-containing protein